MRRACVVEEINPEMVIVMARVVNQPRDWQQFLSTKGYLEEEHHVELSKAKRDSRLRKIYIRNDRDFEMNVFCDGAY
jgi:hypothetical protein